MISMMRLVFDTNVLTAAARSRHGASHELLASLPHAGFQPAVSVALFVEYRAVLLRPENLLGRTAAQAEAFLDYLLSFPSCRKSTFSGGPPCPTRMTTWFWNWRLPQVAVILSRTTSAIFGVAKNGASRP
jgi:hypothetical protein